MRRMGRPALFILTVMVVGLPLLALRGATTAQDAYLFVSPSVMGGGPVFHSLTLLNPANENAYSFRSEISTPADLRAYRGLSADFSFMSAYYLAGGSAFTIALDSVAPETVVVYQIGADGTASPYFDVSFDVAGYLSISTAGEAAPATYLVGTRSAETPLF